MKITVNLATRPFADLGPILKRLRIAMAVFVVLSIAFGYGLHLLHAKAQIARAKMQGLDNQVSSINRERQRYTAMMAQPATSSGFRPCRSASHPAGQTTSIQAAMLTTKA